MIPSAYLRVFRPLETFEGAERAFWERYIVRRGDVSPARPVYREEASEPEQRLGLLALAEGDDADIRLADDRYYVCPRRTRLRVLASILSFREFAPPEIVEAFVPDGQVRRAARELARMKRRGLPVVPCVLQSPWHVPVRWFLLVDDDERRLVEVSPDEYRLYYWTPAATARRRAKRARRVLRGTELAAAADKVADLGRWLSSFPVESFVELDYASVSSLFTWDELDDDHSGHDMQQAMEALASSDGLVRAGELYHGVCARWTEARGRESLS